VLNILLNTQPAKDSSVMVETSFNKFDAYHPSLPSLLYSMLVPP
jgi:hypothetical protein